MQKKTYLGILSLILVAAFSSCVNKKQIAYFQNEGNQLDTISVIKPYLPKIQTGDILMVSVTSLSPLASSFFNPYTSGSTEGAGSSGSATPGDVTGFLVDNAGAIELPLIGSVKLAGYTTTQARDTIKNRLKFYLKEPTINVRFLNYKISVMGEVAKPSIYLIPNEKVTLPEALTMAGDLTVFGKRDNILIIRDNDGKKEFGRVNLNGRDVFNSPYYYLHSGDLIYVEPGRGKISQASDVFRVLPAALGIVSLLITVYIATKR